MVIKDILLKATVSLAVIPSFISLTPVNTERLLAQEKLNLSNRYKNGFVNEVFKDNILLTLFYMRGGKVIQKLSWEEVKKPFHFEMILYPNDLFTFHEDLLDEFKSRQTKTTNSHFNSAEGFKSDGYLIGDGVCHLASFINWVASISNLEVKAPTDHNFAAIPEVPKKYGTSIYFRTNTKRDNALQNLYISNNKEVPINFLFEYDGLDTITLKVVEQSLILRKVNDFFIKGGVVKSLTESLYF